MDTEIDKLSLKINIDGAEKDTADNINAIATAIEALNTAVSSSGALDNLAKYSAGLQKMADSFQKAIAEMEKFSSSNLPKMEVPSGKSDEDKLPSAKGGKSASEDIKDEANATERLEADIVSLMETANKYTETTRYLKDGTEQLTQRFEEVGEGFKRTTTVIDGYIQSIREVENLEEDVEQEVRETNTDFLDQARAIEDVARQAEKLGGRVTTTERVLADGTSETTQKVEYLGDTFKKTEVYVNGLLKSMQQMPVVQKELNDATKKSTSGWSKFTRAVGRIALYRAIRSVLKSITKAMTEGIQNYAKYSESANKSISNIKNSFQQVKDSFGVTLGYLLEAFEPIITTISDGVVKLAENINMALASMSGKSTYSKAIKQNEDYAKSLDKVNNKLLSFDKFESLNKDGNNNEPRYEEVELGDELPEAAQAFKDIFDIVKEIVDAVIMIVEKLKPLVKKILPPLKKIIEKASESLEKILPLLTPIIELLLELVEPILDVIYAISDALAPVIEVILKVVTKILEFVVPIIKFILEIITTIIGAVSDGISNMKGWFENFGTNVKNIFANVKDWFVNLGTKIKDVFAGIGNGIKNAFQTVTNWFRDRIRDIGDWFKNLGESIKNIFKKVFEFVKNLYDNTIGKVVDGVKNVVGGIKNFFGNVGNTVKGWFGFANGGVPETGTVFYAGEAGAEIVYNTRGGQSGVANVEQISQAMLQALINYNAAQNGQTGGGNVYLDGRQVGQLVESSVYREGVRVGHFKKA